MGLTETVRDLSATVQELVDQAQGMEELPLFNENGTDTFKEDDLFLCRIDQTGGVVAVKYKDLIRDISNSGQSFQGYKETGSMQFGDLAIIIGDRLNSLKSLISISNDGVNIKTDSFTIDNHTYKLAFKTDLLSSDREISFQDKSGTVAFLSDITNGVENYAELLDKETVDLPTINTPLNNALNNKANSADLADYIPISDKGSNNGVAELDASGKVPAGQLPSFVDEISEYADLASFPATGESGKIYIALNTNKVYRWGGTVYTEISESIALGETSTTAHRGDRGKVAYDHTFETDNPHNVTKAQLGLGNVDNTSDVDKPVSTATQNALNNKEDNLGNPTVNGRVLSSSISGTRSWVDIPSGSATSETGTAIGLSNVLGSTDPSPTPYTANTYTIKPGAVLLGYGTRLIDTTGKTEFPTVTGATPLPTSNFEANKLYWLHVLNRGDKVYYWFEAQDHNAGGGTGTGLELGETSTTAYRGDRGKTAYDHSQQPHAPADAQKNVQTDWNASSGDALLKNKPSSFPPSAHNHPISQVTGLQTALDGKMDNADIGPVRIFNQDPLTLVTATGTSWNSILGTQKIELTAAQVAAGKSYSLRIFGKIDTTDLTAAIRKFRAVITAGGASEYQEAAFNASIVTQAQVDIDGIFDFGGTTANTLVGFYGSGMLLKLDGISPIGFISSAGNPINATNGVTVDIQFQGAFAVDTFTSRKIQVLDINNQVILTV